MSDKTIELSGEIVDAVGRNILQGRGNITDFDTVPKSGIYNYGKDAANRPSGLGEYGFVLMFWNDSIFGLQVAFSDRGGKLCYRCHWTDGWHVWRIL